MRCQNMFGVPYPVFTRAPLVGSLDMDYWCSAFGTKGARVNTGYGTPNMFENLVSTFIKLDFFLDLELLDLKHCRALVVLIDRISYHMTRKRQFFSQFHPHAL